MRFLTRLAPVSLLLGTLSCTESTVPKNQVILNLIQVDGKYLPVMVDASGGSQMSVEEGRIGEGIGGTCDFQIRFFAANSFSPITGTVPNCKLTAGQKVTVKIDMTAQTGIGEHLYVFN